MSASTQPQPLASTLVLASASPRRSHLLETLGLRFEVHPAHIDENEATDAAPEPLVLENARRKAQAVAPARPDAIVLGADTVVALEGMLLHKPADLDEARQMLHRLSGRTHVVHTGVHLLGLSRGLAEGASVTSEVVFKVLNDAAIDAYFERVNPLDKAGAYGIQEGREWIIERYRGSLANIMGLPIEHLKERLQSLGLWDMLHLTQAD
ncbi:MAG: Maf family protein [Opitutales bacterium]